MRLLFLFIEVSCLLLVQSLSALSFSNKYDKDIIKAVKRYSLDLPSEQRFVKLKAQLYQESRLKAQAVSPVGASGLGQIMPKTKIQLWQELKFDQNITVFSTYHNIIASAYYMHKLRKEWNWKRPIQDKHELALASYNAGLGHLLKAQSLCNNALLYDDIIVCLPQVTGHHSKETITYIKRINLWESYLTF